MTIMGETVQGDWESTWELTILSARLFCKYKLFNINITEEEEEERRESREHTCIQGRPKGGHGQHTTTWGGPRGGTEASSCTQVCGEGQTSRGSQGREPPSATRLWGGGLEFNISTGGGELRFLKPIL